jgi:hypothetical protein
MFLADIKATHAPSVPIETTEAPRGRGQFDAREDSQGDSKVEREEDSEAKAPKTEANEEGENVQAHGLTGTFSSERRDDPAKQGLGHIVAK